MIVDSNVFHGFTALVKQAIAQAGYPECSPVIELPRDENHGNWTTPVAMMIAKSQSMAPRVVAEKIIPFLARHDDILKADVAGPGFINVTMKPAFWQAQIAKILNAGLSYGESNLGGNIGVNIEYCSANPTGPMHTAHARGTCLGDALANLLSKVGYKVTREYYINDAGNQIDVLARSTFLRYREALGQDIGEIPAGLYPGEYLKDVAQSLVARDGDRWLSADEAERTAAIKDFAMNFLLDKIKQDLADLHVAMDVFTSEKKLRESGAVEACLHMMTEQGLVYRGVLEPPKGKAAPEDWEPKEQTLFRATEFGDDIDRVLVKADGGYAYRLPDIAYHLDKFKRSGPIMITVVGADHSGWVKSILAAVAAVTDRKAQFSVKMVAMVNTLDNGKPVRMSKRAGTFVTLNDIVERVGGDVMRFVMLSRSPDQVIDFDFAKVVEQSKENPVFYVQYAHARCYSVMRQAKESDFDLSHLESADTSLLNDDDELRLIRKIAGWGRLIEQAAQAQEPHRIVYYLQDVAATFHALWNKGSECTTLRFIREDAPAVSLARLAMVKAVATTIASGLKVLGIEAVKEMRS